MSDDHKPLTAAEIEELRERLETPDYLGNVWLDEITTPEELLRLLAMLTPPADAKVASPCCGSCTRRAECTRSANPSECVLFSIGPADAAVREAMESLVQAIGWADMHQQGDDEVAQVSVGEARILLSYIRAAQGQCLTGEWQPIDTAPEHREVLISGFNNNTPGQGRWVAAARNDGSGWYTPGEDKDNTYYPPTHWMPYPKTPQDVPGPELGEG